MTPNNLFTFSVLAISLILSTPLFGQNDTEKLDYDTSKIAIIKFEYQKSLKQVFDSSYSATSLNNNDMTVIENLILSGIEEYNSKRDLQNRKDLRIDGFQKKYVRQYVPAQKEIGQKIVYVYCFCSLPLLEKTNWRQHLLLIDDGSRCVFRLKVDLLRKKIISEIQINGAG